MGWAFGSGAFQRAWGGGWGAACVPFPRSVRPGGPLGLGLALPPSVPVPSLGRQQSGCSGRRSSHGGRGPHTVPVRVRLLSWGAVRVAPWCVGAGSLVHRGYCGSRRLGRGGGPCSSLPPGRRGPAGGGGITFFASGGVEARAPVACGSVGGGGDRGGVAPWLPSSLSGGGGLRPSAQPPFRRRRIPSRCMHSSGVVGQPRAPGAACRQRASLAGGGGVAAREPPLWGGDQRAGGPGGCVASLRPSALPGRATLQASLGTLGSWGRGPHTAPVRSRAPPPGCGSCAVLARWCGVTRLPRPPRGQAVGGAGARGMRVQLRPPPGRHGPFWGREDAPSAAGGGRGSAPPWPAGRGGVGGRGEGGPRRCFPLIRPGGRPVGPGPVPLPLRRTPPGYTRVSGRSWAPGAVRSAAGG